MRRAISIASAITTWVVFAVHHYALDGIQKLAVQVENIQPELLPTCVRRWEVFAEAHGPLSIALIGTATIAVLHWKFSERAYLMALVSYHVCLVAYTLTSFAICVTPMVNLVNTF